MDKIEKIRQEIEKIKNEEYNDGSISSDVAIGALDLVLAYIDTLRFKSPFIPSTEDIKEAAKSYAPPFNVHQKEKYKFNYSNQIQREKRKAFLAGVNYIISYDNCTRSNFRNKEGD